MKRIILITTSFFASLYPANAQDDIKVLDALYNDFSIPDASAFSLLGINPSKITRPSSTKELSSALVNAANSGKGISPGICIEWAPMLTFDKRFLKNDTVNRIYKDFKHYKETFFQRNLQLSFATVQDSAGSKVALGLSCLVFDRSDPKNNEAYALKVLKETTALLTPLYEYTDILSKFGDHKDSLLSKLGISPVSDPEFYIEGPCQIKSFNDSLVLKKDSLIKLFVDKLKLNAGDPKYKYIDTLVTEYIAVYKVYRKKSNKDKATLLKILKKQQEDYKKEHWNDGMLKFGVGQVWNSRDNAWKNLQSQKVTAYGAWAIPVGKKFGQLIILSQFGYNYETDSVNLAQFICGARLLAGNNNIHGSIEIANQYYEYRKSDLSDVKSKNNLRSTVGLEFKMSEGFWLEFAVGVDADSKDFYKTASMLSLANLKYTFKKEARFKL